MASPLSPGPARSTAPAADWPAQVAGSIESVVGKVRDRTTVPLQTIARAVVFGIIVATMGAVALVLFAIAAIRIMETYLPWGGVWLPDLIVGGLFTVLGLFLFGKSRPRKET